jgi:hypothetical protein
LKSTGRNDLKLIREEGGGRLNSSGVTRKEFSMPTTPFPGKISLGSKTITIFASSIA